MKKIFLLCMITTVHYFSFSQDDSVPAYKKPGKESLAYHEYRNKLTVPPYGLQKIRSLITKIKSDSDGNTVLNQRAYLALTLPEKFTYNMLNAESFSQNCDAMPPIQEEQKKIFAQLPDAFGEYAWSDHQSAFFLANRDSVISLMRICIDKNKSIGLNFKHVIVDIDAKEMIPVIISTYYAEKKDHDLLTVLMLLLKNNEYPAFLLSPSYKKLYADKYASYTSYLNFSPDNEALIIKRANDFYNGLPR